MWTVLPRRTALALTAAAALLVTAGCTGSAEGKAEAGVQGPLCDALPSGTEPGNPTALATEPVDSALTWITVLTTFEGAMRASDLLPELKGKSGITVFAPSDDAFAAKFSSDNLDELMIKDKDTLRTLLRAHVVDRSLSLAELRDAGSVKTLDGTTLTVTAADSMARIGPDAQTVCADYRIANGRIHIINHVLGNLPTTAGTGSDPGH
ncbi:putative surface protein with fasciclin (FAS1) repeats [Asanoa ferruginea]|uniref:Putative surface protein with fasciclin (FAS1) repeats n=1 Tax=Asanoa ferruginea TaxID=53367 RepID=A0A3D9ZQE7_9ACTN|nr:fasciclin domain-containing protein [Asanoa ferruginea]REF98193.1 putative surface protein with fasciclin (FAS1) repeats [Asanoa ferruginea]GIF50837.1 lipoprotein [Asanoa ferruginea]